MAGFIYIAGAFTEPTPRSSGIKAWRDNDPHFWSDPPTWGICRPDLREKCSVDDYIFYVLPKASRLPQMIFGYIKIQKITTHVDAYNDVALLNKRMVKLTNPKGNIIVTAAGTYNPIDVDHKKGFNRIKKHYVIGDISNSKLLDESKIQLLAPKFLPEIERILNSKSSTPFKVISRYGRSLDNNQVQDLLHFLA